ncbi:MAG: acyltransferase [Candidatus Parcubacteria bacterium]|nr:acyltransferase [Candidatus Parcubacteria bacterium]
MEKISLLIPTLLILIIPYFRKIYFCVDCRVNDQKVAGRDLFFDFLKGLAILAVIFIHVAYANNKFTADGLNNSFVLVMNNLARFAIPFFFICSGILLSPINNVKELKDFYARKIWRIFLPYLLCCLAFAFVLNQTLGQFFYNLLAGRADVPYYFIIVLLQLYLLYPLLSIAKANKYFLALFFLLSLFTNIAGVRYIHGVPLCFDFLFFFCYGLACRDMFINYKQKAQEQYFWLSLVVLYFLLMFFKLELYYNTRLFYGLALFNLLFIYRNYIINNRLIFNHISKIGQNSLWIYLLHFQIVLAINKIFYLLQVNLYIRYFLVFVIATLLSLLVAKAVQIVYDNLINLIFDKPKKGYARFA